MTMTMKDTKRYLDTKFYYEPDGKIDTWHIIDYKDINAGDCDDYALTLMYIYSGESLLKMYWNMLTCKIRPWLVKTKKGSNHIVLWTRGEGWTDNIMSNVSETSPDYEYICPVPVAYVAFKQLMGKLIND